MDWPRFEASSIIAIEIIANFAFNFERLPLTRDCS
jgi:hypothetical protein